MRTNSRWAALLVVLFLAVTAIAQMPPGEKKITSNGKVYMTGFTHIEVNADGEATLKVWSNSIARPWASGSDAHYTITENSPRQFSASAGIDSVEVTLVDATYVILSWR